LDKLHDILENGYGITAEGVKKLDGYDSENFRIFSDGKKYLIKIFTATSTSVLSEIQAQLLSKLKDPIGRFPKIIHTKDGENIYYSSSGGTKEYTMLYTFLEGEILADSKLDDALVSDFGRVLAELDYQLQDFDPGMVLVNESIWDLKNFSKCRDYFKFIKDRNLKRIIHYFIHQLESKYFEFNWKLRKSWIHGDANSGNVLVANGRISGIIDFGDITHSYLINEVAIALSYALSNNEDPLYLAYVFLKAYNRKLTIEEIELEYLYDLIAGRLCITYTMAAYKSSLFPDEPYYTISQRGAENLLRNWIKINPIKAKNVFREACGYLKSVETSHSEILKDRKDIFSSSLSLSYDSPIHISGAAFQYLFDIEGNTYVDCVNNIPHVGHCHPVVVEAGQKQMSKLNTNTRYLYPHLTDYAKLLLKKFPDKLNKVFFVNSGSAATDLAIRIAKNYCENEAMVIMQYGYHGNTDSAIKVSSYKFDGKGGKGKPENTLTIPMPDPLKPLTNQKLRAIEKELKDFMEKFKGKVSWISESILGCGGQVNLPKGFLKTIYQVIQKNGGVCIADEVQTGFGRTGNNFWAFEEHEILPDIVILGKPIGNGHPMGAVVCNEDVVHKFENGMEFFSSFGGNPVSCSIGKSVLDVIDNENLQEEALHTGTYLLKGFTSLKEKYSIIGHIRGSGLFWGIELVEPNTNNTPAPRKAHDLINTMKTKGFLLSTDGPFKNVIKIKPPMCFDKKNAASLIHTLDNVFSTLSQKGS
jgi:4-aminobutyrate aminotransferase-like enzyme/Ser/Thr protein kinase RdoA (MazF antagonist)